MMQSEAEQMLSRDEFVNAANECSRAKGFKHEGETYVAQGYCTYEVWSENPCDFMDRENPEEVEEWGYDATASCGDEQVDYEWGEHWCNNPEDSCTLHERLQEYGAATVMFFRVWFRDYAIIMSEENYSSDYGGCDSCEDFVYYNGECIHNDFEQFRSMQKWWSSPVSKQVIDADDNMHFINYPIKGVCEETPALTAAATS